MQTCAVPSYRNDIPMDKPAYLDLLIGLRSFAYLSDKVYHASFSARFTVLWQCWRVLVIFGFGNNGMTFLPFTFLFSKKLWKFQHIARFVHKIAHIWLSNVGFSNVLWRPLFQLLIESQVLIRHWFVHSQCCNWQGVAVKPPPEKLNANIEPLRSLNFLRFSECFPANSGFSIDVDIRIHYNFSNFSHCWLVGFLQLNCAPLAWTSSYVTVHRCAILALECS